jgi:putative FmdB family regulatory protein
VDVRCLRGNDKLGFGGFLEMPIYEYECGKCGNTLEALQTFSEKPLTKCPQCSGKLHKLISQSTFHLKGSGWYATDYSKKSNSAVAPSSKTKQTSDSPDTPKASGKTKSSSD